MKKNNENQMSDEINVELENMDNMHEENKSNFQRETNVVELCGYVGFDPEVHNFASGNKKIRFKIATHSKIKGADETEPRFVTNWFPVVAWNKAADEALEWLRSGTKVRVKGFLNYRAFEDKDGNKRSMFETVATELTSVA